MINQYPPKVDGLYVLRMHYGKADYGLYSATYPVSVIQVIGNSWRLVQGGTVDCAAAKAVSNEQLTGVADREQVTAHAPSRSQKTVSSHRAQALKDPASALVHGRATTSSTSGDRPASTTQGSSSQRSAPGSPDASARAAADTTGTSTTSGTSWVLWLLIGVIVVLAAALLAVFRFRRPSHSET